MYGVRKNKLNNSDKAKIRARFNSKMQEYDKMSLEELKPILESKLSSTDKYALEVVIDGKIKQNLAKSMEEQSKESSEIKEEENGSNELTN